MPNDSVKTLSEGWQGNVLGYWLDFDALLLFSKATSAVGIFPTIAQPNGVLRLLD